MADDRELVDFIIYTMKYYGSDAGERKVKGSKLLSQAEHIADFVQQRNDAHTLLSVHKLNLVTVKAR